MLNNTNGARPSTTLAPADANPAAISARNATSRTASAAASVTACGVQQAAMAVSCSVPSGQCAR